MFRGIVDSRAYGATDIVPERMQSSAMLVLQHAAEEFLCGLFEDSVLCAVHAKRSTVTVPDYKLARRLRRDQV